MAKTAESFRQYHLVKDFTCIILPFQGSKALSVSDYNHIIPARPVRRAFRIKAGTADMIIEK